MATSGTGQRRSRARAARVNQSLDRLTAYLSVRSKGGTNVFAGNADLRPEAIEQYFSTNKDTQRACIEISSKGFEIERVGRLSVRISGPAKLFERRFGLKFERRTADKTLSQAFLLPYTPTPQTQANLLQVGMAEVDGLAFPQPIELHAVSANPPKPKYHHLRIPDDVVAGLNAGSIHQQGTKGQNVRAAMIDSGFGWNHPYFVKRKYKLDVALPQGDFTDTNGHGTGESANFLALAPEAHLYGLSMDDTIAAFQVARDELGVQIISNSWGSAFPTDGQFGTWDPYWSLVKAEIALCAQQGIIVMFSGGNGGMSFTASMPETISVGGVYVDENGVKQASDYASSFDSTRFPGQHVPEVCGLVGMRPKAIYITLPVPPGCDIDTKYGGKSFPQQDETKTKDGWALFSGTSAACPMVAGVVALILSKFPGSDLAQVRQRLYKAQDVTKGKSAMGDAAGPGFDAATGHGLVDAAKACA